MVTLRRTLAAAVALALAGSAQAQDGGGRQGSLVALSRVLGESQALREACEGKKDQYWRSRMMRLLSLEKADGAAGAPLTAAFNAGYAEASQAHPDCGPESRRAEVDAAARGQDLAAVLAGPTAAAPRPPAPDIDPPDDVGAPFEPR
ncbi:TIGR02301 family protein [Phenylobacterium sp.]|uniref:TIGR02301 family protein n=1 Tax=Phenylobacterium sp. TaxID=1871053 RepID=UPI002E34AA0B|nr:TIGR02301 family protein [Phenylobacterium sp.]HEX2560811.1 TIGR02301 family protein [Phenylobacterium sp.]